MLSYEERLNSDSRWALSEGSKHFEERSAVQLALRQIAQRLEELGIPYAVAGGMALFAHGLRRFTEDVDILVTREGLNVIHSELEGRGYVPPFSGSKNLRDAVHGVRIEFLVAGQFPGDGKPKPVAFPDPARVGVESDGIRYLNLPTLVELKLASGMSSEHRLKDLADVQELIKLQELPEQFVEQLDPYVQAKYRELYAATRPSAARYYLPWPRPSSAASIANLDDLIAEVARIGSDIAQLEKMRTDGVTLASDRGALGGYVYLATVDPGVAAKYGMHEESQI